MAGYEVSTTHDGCSNVRHKKDGLHLSDKITLEHFSGVYHVSKDALSANPINGNIAFPASSVLVILDPQSTQQGFVENPSSREITAVTFSDDGRLVAYGENGLHPSISVLNAKHYTKVNRFKIDGKCTIKALLFHPRSIYLAVLPYHDYSVLIYDFVCGSKLAGTKWCVEPVAVAMTKMSSVLAVCGHRKITCFSLSNIDLRCQTSAVMDRHAVFLGKYGQLTFIDITCGQEIHGEYIYTITSCGHLCLIKSGNVVLNKVNAIGSKCFCIKYKLRLLFIGCEQGRVNICDPENLTVCTGICVHDIFGPDQMQPVSWIVKSDVLAISINPATNVITALLSDQKRHSWHFSFCQDFIKCSPVIAQEDCRNPSTVPEIVTNHELQCHLANKLLQLEQSKLKQRGRHFLQRHSFPRRMPVNAIKITPDGKEIISGNKLGEIKIFNATSGILTKVIEAHNSAVTVIEILYSDSLKLVASGGRDRTILILDMAKDYQLVQAICENSAAIVSLSLVFSDGILTLVSSSADGVILIRRSFESSVNFVNVGGLPECVGCKKRVYNHSNGYIIIGQERGRINLFSAHPYATLKPARKLKIGDSLLKTVNIDPTGSFFVSYSAVGQNIFHLQTGQHVASVCSLPGFSHLSFSQDLNYLINSNDSGCKFLWRLPQKIVDVMKSKANMIVTATPSICLKSYISYIQVYQQLVDEDPKIDRVPEWANAKASKEQTQLNSMELVDELSQCERDLLSLVDTRSQTSCTTYSRSDTVLLSDDSITTALETTDMTASYDERMTLSEINKEISETSCWLTNFNLCEQNACTLSPIDKPADELELIENHNAEGANDAYRVEDTQEIGITARISQSDIACEVGDPINDFNLLPYESVMDKQNSIQIFDINSKEDDNTHSTYTDSHTLVTSLRCKSDASGCENTEYKEELNTMSVADACSGVKISEKKDIPNTLGNMISPYVSIHKDEEQDSLPRIPNSISDATMDFSICEEDVKYGGDDLKWFFGEDKVFKDVNPETVGENCDIQRFDEDERITDTNDSIHMDPPLQQTEVNATKDDGERKSTFLKSCQSTGIDKNEIKTEYFPNDTQVVGSISFHTSLSTHSITYKRDQFETAHSNEKNQSKMLKEFDTGLLKQDFVHSNLNQICPLHDEYNELCRCVQLSNSQETYFLKLAEQGDVLCDIQQFQSPKRQKDIDDIVSENKREVPIEATNADFDLEEHKRELGKLDVDDDNDINGNLTKTTKDKTGSPKSPVVRRETTSAKYQSHQKYAEIHKIRTSRNSPVLSVEPKTDQEPSEDCCLNIETTVVESQTQMEQICQNDATDAVDQDVIDQEVDQFSIQKSLMTGSRLTGCSSTSTNSQNILDRIGCVADLFRNQDDYLRKLKKVRRDFEMSIKALSVERKNLQKESQKRYQGVE